MVHPRPDHPCRRDLCPAARHGRGGGAGLLAGRGPRDLRGGGGGRDPRHLLHPPQPGGGGAHVANCGYMTAAAATGRGVARAMCAHSLEHARARGYRAMQFNCVVSTNERAVRLWQAMGFEILARLPGAFRHPTAGEVDALVMFQAL
ncbi:GNAT family N-acetyltransferase [Teichococcus aestuarii]|uniref:GNAT family N-acetyltransferase n=1 Tax=Teichococcus aestuarii TaxID=568898 RepID=UPI003613DB35